MDFCFYTGINMNLLDLPKPELKNKIFSIFRGGKPECLYECYDYIYINFYIIYK